MKVTQLLKNAGMQANWEEVSHSSGIFFSCKGGMKK